jgi:hypothetical protein
MISSCTVSIFPNRNAAWFDAVGIGKGDSLCSGIIRENSSRNDQIVVAEDHAGRSLTAFLLFKGASIPQEIQPSREGVTECTTQAVSGRPGAPEVIEIIGKVPSPLYLVFLPEDHRSAQ